MITTKEPTTINLYFGEQHLDTLSKLDEMKSQLRRSRTQTIDFLMTYFETNESQKSISRVFWWKLFKCLLNNINHSIRENRNPDNQSRTNTHRRTYQWIWPSLSWSLNSRRTMRLRREKRWWRVWCLTQLILIKLMWPHLRIHHTSPRPDVHPFLWTERLMLRTGLCSLKGTSLLWWVSLIWWGQSIQGSITRSWPLRGSENWITHWPPHTDTPREGGSGEGQSWIWVEDEFLSFKPQSVTGLWK